MTERPLFIDPIATGEGDEVDDNPAPVWFVGLALVILTIAAYYLGSFLNGPRESSPHRFEHGREVAENAGHGEPAPTPSAASPAPATPSPTSTPEGSLAPTQGQTTTRASTPTASPTG